jgi:hypothetical protein
VDVQGGEVVTPAQLLAAAADRLDKLTAEAVQDWKVDDDNHLGLLMIKTPYTIGPLSNQPDSRFGFAGPDDATTVYIAAMDPRVGKALAEVFRVWARMGRLDPDLLRRVGGDETVALARLIVGGES